MEQERGCGCGLGLFLLLMGLGFVVLLVPFIGLPVFVLVAIGALTYGWFYSRGKQDDDAAGDGGDSGG